MPRRAMSSASLSVGAIASSIVQPTRGSASGPSTRMRVALVLVPRLDVDVVRRLVDRAGHIRFMPWRPAVTGLPGYQNGIGFWNGLVESGIVGKS